MGLFTVAIPETLHLRDSESDSPSASPSTVISKDAGQGWEFDWIVPPGAAAASGISVDLPEYAGAGIAHAMRTRYRSGNRRWLLFTARNLRPIKRHSDALTLPVRSVRRSIGFDDALPCIRCEFDSS